MLRIITNRYRQRDYAKGMYFCPFEPNKQGVGLDQPFLVNPYLLEHRVVEDVSGAYVVNEDLVCIVVSYPYVDDECIVMQVVETSSIFL